VSATVLYMSMSLDGFIAGPNAGPGNGLGDGGERLHEWMHSSGTDPDAGVPGRWAGANGQLFDEIMATGAIVAGRATFEPAGGWGGDHHDGVPIWILSRREPGIDVSQWSLVTYTNDVKSAMAGAKRAAGEKNVLVHGASTAQLDARCRSPRRARAPCHSRAPRARAPYVRQPRARARRATAHANHRGRRRCHPHALPRPALNTASPRLPSQERRDASQRALVPPSGRVIPERRSRSV
jgi:dihydrofolate reductase